MSAEASVEIIVAEEPSIEGAVVEAVALLRRVRGLPSKEAQAQLHALVPGAAPLTLDLVPERNHYSGEVEYGVLIRSADETAYVTSRGRQSTPWLLHQVHDFRESILLSVDAETMSVGEAVAALDELLDHAALCERMIDSCIINRELKRRSYAVSDEELQAEVNAMRRRRGLFTAAETEHWMRAHGVSQLRLEKMAAMAVRVRRLRQELCAAEVESHFHTHREELVRAALVRLRFADAEQARRASACLSSGESFFALAEQLLGNDLRQGVAATRLDSRVVMRHELEPSFAADVFRKIGAVVGPQVTPEGVYLVYVSSVEPALQLDAELRQVIERKLFARWLRQERERATIEWNWGHDD